MLSQLIRPQRESSYVKHHHCESGFASLVVLLGFVFAIRCTCNGILTAAAGNDVDTMHHFLGSHNYVPGIPSSFPHNGVICLG